MTTTMPKGQKKVSEYVIQIPPDESFCIGCNACEIVCGLVHDSKVGPSVRRIFLARDTIMLEHNVFACEQCIDHPCYNACPRKGSAMLLDEELNIVYINESECIGCKLCIRACPLTPKRINFDPSTQKAKKCDLCRTRSGGPACIEYCPVLCLELGRIKYEEEETT